MLVCVIQMLRCFFLSESVWLAFAAHTSLVLAALLLADQLPWHEAVGFLNPSLKISSPIIDKFIRWDAHWYTYIAENGYTAQTLVFFPVIIAAIKMLINLGLGYAAAGFAICNLFAFLSFSLLNFTFRLDFSEKVTRRALLAYAVMPTSFFLNSVYTEPLFIVFSLACIYCTRVRMWWYAGIFGALAALTRNLGVLLFFVILYEYWLAYRQQARLSLNVLSIFFAPLALCGFMAYNFWLVGDPITFIHSQRSWGRQFGWPWDSFSNNFQVVLTSIPYPEPGTVLDSLTVSVALIGLLLLTFSSRYKIPNSYLIIGWLWFLVPLFSTSPVYPLYSMARFVLVVFPLYLFIAQLSTPYYYCCVIIGALLLPLCTALFFNWFWLG